MSEDFSELQRVYFFQPNVSGDKPLQLVMWHIFNRNIDKSNRQFKIEIAKSIPHIGIVTNYGQTCWSKIYFSFAKKFIIFCVVVISASVLSILYMKLNGGNFMIWIRQSKWFVIVHKKYDPKITVFPVYILKNGKKNCS